MLDGSGRAGAVNIKVSEAMILAGCCAASAHFFEDSDYAIVTPEAVAEICEAMLAC